MFIWLQSNHGWKNFIKIFDNWDPHNLTDDQRYLRIVSFASLNSWYTNRPFLIRIMTINYKWVTLSNIKNRLTAFRLSELHRHRNQNFFSQKKHETQCYFHQLIKSITPKKYWGFVGRFHTILATFLAFCLPSITCFMRWTNLSFETFVIILMMWKGFSNSKS